MAYRLLIAPIDWKNGWDVSFNGNKGLGKSVSVNNKGELAGGKKKIDIQSKAIIQKTAPFCALYHIFIFRKLRYYQRVIGGVCQASNPCDAAVRRAREKFSIRIHRG